MLWLRPVITNVVCSVARDGIEPFPGDGSFTASIPWLLGELRAGRLVALAAGGLGRLRAFRRHARRGGRGHGRRAVPLFVDGGRGARGGRLVAGSSMLPCDGRT